MKIFNLASAPLSGINLIEASAGTGKTYALAGLFIRLIVEEEMPAGRILIVTFTKAATEELKERIREKLAEANDAFDRGYHSDAFLDGLIKKNGQRGALFLIRRAMAEFDDASIFTIHGFCSRILSDHAFESENLFDTELVSGNESLIRQIAEDFWRKQLSFEPGELIAHALSKGITGPDYYQRLFQSVKAPGVEVIPDIEKPALGFLETYRDSLERLGSAWPESRAYVKALFYDPSLSATVFGGMTPSGSAQFSKRDFKISALIEEMDRFADPENLGFPLFKGFENFTATKIAAAVKKKCPLVRHPFFDMCDQLRGRGDALGAEMDRYLLFLDVQFIKFARAQMVKRKKTDRVKSFDDLLTGVRDALADRSNPAFSTEIKKKYDAALIDEFQDTDFLQYDIFQSLFSSPDKTLFMIGDPKQAIYGFRGADVFSYMKAAKEAPRRYTLIGNWRSEPALIRGVNAIFSPLSKRPFLFDEIAFSEAVPGRAAHDSTGKDGGDKKPEPDFGTPENISERDAETGARPPLKLWYLSSENRAGKTGWISKGDAVSAMIAGVANEAAKLIGATENPAKPGDIAVLVRTNRQAKQMRRAFLQKHIPATLYNSGNIFGSHEAFEMQTIMAAIADAGNRRLLTAALATEMMGVAGEEMDPDTADLFDRESRLAEMTRYRKIWKSKGFISMFNALMETENLRARLLSFPGGERRLTNLLHLSELLQEASASRGSDINGLLSWLRDARNSPESEGAELQLRLESDAHAATIATIHKCKGLEYPIVFCPFSWEGVGPHRGPAMFHDDEHDRRLVCDLGSEDMERNRLMHQNEVFAENLRLLYVALTRAKSVCHLFWGRINSADTSAMAYLFHYSGAGDLGRDMNLVASVKKEFRQKNEEGIMADLQAIVKRSQGCVELRRLEMAGEAPSFVSSPKTETLSHRVFSGKIMDSWRISSFSSLTSGSHSPGSYSPGLYSPGSYSLGSSSMASYPAGPLLDGPLIRPHDVHEPLGSAVLSGGVSDDGQESLLDKDIFSFPKGARAGLFFHELFESLDFQETDMAAREAFVDEKIQQYDFDPAWKPTVLTMLDHVLATPLSLVSGMTLSDLSLGDRINEMEFHFPMGRLDPAGLETVFSGVGFQGAGFQGLGQGADMAPPIGRMLKLAFAPCRGFMKGFIDLAFCHNGRWYLLDWKSNFLGQTRQDYHQSALLDVMSERFYILQYYIYSVALTRYLKVRIPGYDYQTHFGGVFYVFLRGVRPDWGPKFGIFYDRPSLELLNRFEKAMLS